MQQANEYHHDRPMIDANQDYDAHPNPVTKQRKKGTQRSTKSGDPSDQRVPKMCPLRPLRAIVSSHAAKAIGFSGR